MSIYDFSNQEYNSAFNLGLSVWSEFIPIIRPERRQLSKFPGAVLVAENRLSPGDYQQMKSVIKFIEAHKDSLDNFSLPDLNSFLSEADSLFKDQIALSSVSSRPVVFRSYGPRPVLISACHATSHIRSGCIKIGEKMTGVLAIALGLSLKAKVVLPIRQQSDDPNFDLYSGTYKTTVAGLINDCGLVLDLHGMTDSHHSDICLGFGHHQLQPPELSFIETLQSRGRQNRLRLTLNSPFASCHPGTIAEFARTNGCPAIQSELSLDCRNHRPGLLYVLLRDSLAEIKF